MSFLAFVRARVRTQQAAAAEAPARTAENSGLKASQIEAGRQALALCKLDARAGALSRTDALSFLRAVGLNPTPDGVDTALRKLKLHKASSLTWGELAHVWHALLQDVADEELILLRAFEFFDRDGNGEISIAELRATMAELGNLLSNEEILEFVAALDFDNNGTIGYSEFVAAMCSQRSQFAQDASCAPTTNGAAAGGSGSVAANSGSGGGGGSSARHQGGPEAQAVGWGNPRPEQQPAGGGPRAASELAAAGQ